MKTSFSSRLPQNADIHIDWICVTGQCRHVPVGSLFFQNDSEIGLVSAGARPKEKKLRPGGGTTTLHSRDIGPDGMANRLEIECCPTKVLQRHNVFGHSSLGGYVYEVFDQITRASGIVVESADREAWFRGFVWLTLVHLTGNFRCPRQLILRIIDAIDENNRDGKFRPIPSWITLGMTEKGRSRHHALTLYDKMLQLLDEWRKPGQLRARIIDYVREAIRAEVKLFRDGLNYRELQYVANWQNVDVAALFFELFETYGIQYAIQSQLSEMELETLTLAERNVYKAWLRGESVDSLFKSRSTVGKYAKSIEAKTGRNVRQERPPEEQTTIHLKDIFCPENLLPVPDWMIGTDMFVARTNTSAFPRLGGVSDAPLPTVIPQDMFIEIDGERRVV